MEGYITKDRAMDLIIAASQGHPSRRANLLSKLEDEPAADVAPVKNGRWIYRKRHEGSQRILTGPLVTGKYPDRITHWDNEVSILFDDRYEWDKPFCSLCGRGAEMPDYMFCPYCGARMDGEE